MDALSVTEGRLRALFAAGLAVTSELSLDALLNRLLEAAAELTGARYAALGVIDPVRVNHAQRRVASARQFRRRLHEPVE